MWRQLVESNNTRVRPKSPEKKLYEEVLPQLSDLKYNTVDAPKQKLQEELVVPYANNPSFTSGGMLNPNPPKMVKPSNMTYEEEKQKIDEIIAKVPDELMGNKKLKEKR